MFFFFYYCLKHLRSCGISRCFVLAFKGLVQMSNFTCAEFKSYTSKSTKIISIRVRQLIQTWDLLEYVRSL